MPQNSATAQSFVEAAFPVIRDWYEEQRKPSGDMNTNVMCVALVMVEHVAKAYPLSKPDYLTESQVKEIGAARIKAILARHGETRPFRAEAGRTSRGSMPLAIKLATLLNEAGLDEIFDALDEENRLAARDEIHARIVDWIRTDFFEKQFISADIDPGKPVRTAIKAILTVARSRPGTTGGAVAQHLVGAKLALRFPDLDISNEGYTVADQQTQRAGDFMVGDTAFHVTLSPSDHLINERCRSNRSHGFRSIVIVPEDRVIATRQLADNAELGEVVEVLAIEDFVGQNIEELGTFKQDEIRTQLRQLLMKYNERVSVAEVDPAYKVQVPDNL